MLKIKRKFEGTRFAEKPEDVEMKKAAMPEIDVELYKKIRLRKRKKEEMYKLPEIPELQNIRIKR